MLIYTTNHTVNILNLFFSFRPLSFPRKSVTIPCMWRPTNSPHQPCLILTATAMCSVLPWHYLLLGWKVRGEVTVGVRLRNKMFRNCGRAKPTTCQNYCSFCGYYCSCNVRYVATTVQYSTGTVRTVAAVIE